MKLLLLASLSLNMFLFGAALHLGRHHRHPQFARPLRMEVTAQRSRPFGLFKGRPSAGQPPTTPWQGIESPDPAQFVANLRAIGCPERTIRDIAVFRLSREFHARLQTAYDDDARQQPWWRGRNYSRESLEMSRLHPMLRRERDDLLEEVFGEPANRLISQILDWPSGAAVGREFLAADKRRSLREVDARYSQLYDETTFPVGEPLDEGERSALADLQRRKRAEIEALLTPQQLEELDLRESPAARYALRKLPEAQSEADFRAMVRAAREFGAGEEVETRPSSARRYGLGRGETSGDSQERREEAQQKSIEARVKELLGERHFAQLQQAEAARQAAQQVAGNLNSTP